VAVKADDQNNAYPNLIMWMTARVKLPPIMVTEVGFTDDLPVKRWNSDPAARTDIDPANSPEATWKLVNNPNLPAYFMNKIRTSAGATPADHPKLWAKIAISPTQAGTMTVRVKEGSSIIATATGVSLANSEVTVPGMLAALSRPQPCGKRVYSLVWEASLDGNTWLQIGVTTHTTYWAYTVPINAYGTFDLALQKAFGYLEAYPPSVPAGIEPTATDLALSIAKGIRAEITYRPASIDFQTPSLPDTLPLHAYSSNLPGPWNLGLQCTTHARLMEQLVATVGLQPVLLSTVQCYWGGSKPNVITAYYYPSGTATEVSLGCTRTAEDSAPANPRFLFHAIVQFPDPVTGAVNYFDPIYGLKLAPTSASDLEPFFDNFAPSDNLSAIPPIDHNGDGIQDIPVRRSGAIAAFNDAFANRKRLYTQPTP
jgi:hypothetical protein